MILLEFQHPNPWKLVKQIITAAFEFGDRSNWLDDVTVVVINRLA
jgi:serine phosphatase RsbU (regulator of sigma subunit)